MITLLAFCRMKRKYYSWDEAMNLREVKVSCPLLFTSCTVSPNYWVKRLVWFSSRSRSWATPTSSNWGKWYEKTTRSTSSSNTWRKTSTSSWRTGTVCPNSHLCGEWLSSTLTPIEIRHSKLLVSRSKLCRLAHLTNLIGNRVKESPAAKHNEEDDGDGKEGVNPFLIPSSLPGRSCSPSRSSGTSCTKYCRVWRSCTGTASSTGTWSPRTSSAADRSSSRSPTSDSPGRSGHDLRTPTTCPPGNHSIRGLTRLP